MYIKSNRGGEKFIADGYMYVYDKTSTDGKIKFWRCEFKSDRCRARLHTSVNTNEVIKKLNDHKHGPDPQRIVATQMRNLLKRKAEIMSSIPMIKAELIDTADEECSSSYQPDIYIKEEPDCKISKQDEESNTSSLITAVEYIDIPKSLKFYDLGSGRKIKFLLDDCNGTNEILIFAREDYQDWAQFMKTIYIDSTYKKCPYMYSQICVIMAERNDFVFGIMYIFLQNTKEESFKKMFQNIKKLWPEFNPDTIYVDYTKTSYNALNIEFPSAIIYGCYFLLMDLLNEKIEEYGLLNKYNNDMEYAMQAKMIIAIAFIPKKDIEIAVNLLREHLPKDLLEIFDWFEETFIGQVNNNKNRTIFAQYPFEMWSVYNNVADGKYYLNSSIEMANRQAHAELETDNILVSQFVVRFQVIQRTSDIVYEAFIKGDMPPIKNIHERLMYLVKTYKQRTLYEYIRGVASNI